MWKTAQINVCNMCGHTNSTHTHTAWRSHSELKPPHALLICIGRSCLWSKPGSFTAQALWPRGMFAFNPSNTIFSQHRLWLLIRFCVTVSAARWDLLILLPLPRKWFTMVRKDWALNGDTMWADTFPGGIVRTYMTHAHKYPHTLGCVRYIWNQV